MAKHQPREFWAGHVEAWRSSGLTRDAYCRRHGVSMSSLVRWARKLAGSGQGPAGFLPVAVASTSAVGSAGVVEIAVGPSVRLRVSTEVDARWLGQMLRDAAGC